MFIVNQLIKFGFETLSPLPFPRWKKSFFTSIMESCRCANRVDTRSADISCLLGREVRVTGLPLVKEVARRAGE